MAELLKRIEEYWSGRAEGYSRINHKELSGSQRMAWRTVLEREFPDLPKEEMRILDIGTGPGFFPIILAEAGYCVTAVDCTQKMLEKARENAGELSGSIAFLQMNAQELEFADNTFDVVISRNLTWNLKNPEKAYQEWHRVLKPGGVLLNFDANWYGYLYDEEKRAAYEQDRQNVEQQKLEDHYLGTDIDVMEQIAREVPLSGVHRPQWDEEVLTKLGFEVSVDTDIWKQVWSREEKWNYGSTPMFLVRGKKREAFRIGGIKVQPGTRFSGCIGFGDGEFELPVTVLHGSRPGKTVLVTAGIHAEEYVGIQASMELAERLDIQRVCGTVILVKVVNRRAFENRSGSFCMEDGKNLNREFPGNPGGTEAERLAWAVASQIHPLADCYIDLHSGDSYEKLAPYVYYPGMASEEVVARSRQMAEQVDVAYMVRSTVAGGGSYNYAALRGIPSILIERGGMGAWSSQEVQAARKDVRNILCSLGVYEGRMGYRTYYPMEVADVRYLAATYTGCWYPFREPGDIVRQGETLGVVKDYEGKTLETFEAEYDGVILYETGSLQVVQEGPAVAYGKILQYQDRRKERIRSYWTKRSDNFLEQRRAELKNPLAKRWLKEIEKQLPVGKGLRILDVGCGVGFFSILLAKKGYEVTGIDLTPEMIAHAGKLAMEEEIVCDFQIMDAEKLSFEDESFDVVISRNLTWNLPHAQKAYREWSRVLRKGGVLLNFDANYGASDFTDTNHLPSNHAHRQVGESMMRECEEIKRQLPISAYIRPAWDLETLGSLGMEQFSIDLGISSRLYLEQDEFYNPTPLFMIRAQKGTIEK